MKITFQEFLLKFFLLSPKKFISKQLPIFQRDLHPGCILSIFPMARQGKISFFRPPEGLIRSLKPRRAAMHFL
jgi:hypothetical protein